ncbi:MAG: VRR-NUC domain-containing protein [Peptococcaceae bacterium]|nr:VRR-NUC domain-containing protein [Peptococcaceae bacterium]
MKESDIQNLIRIHVSNNQLGTLFRVNVGEAWTGNNVIHNLDGSITIYRPRRLNTGLPVGFSDLFGINNLGRAIFIEVKSKSGKLSPEQENFLRMMTASGAYAGVAKCPEDAVKIINGLNIGL